MTKNSKISMEYSIQKDIWRLKFNERTQAFRNRGLILFLVKVTLEAKATLFHCRQPTARSATVDIQ
jgi:hypothetical protein